MAGTLPAGTQPVLNLPSGGVYTTVVEAATQGRLRFPEAAGAHDVTLDFEAGRILRIEAARGVGERNTLFDQHTGEPRRMSHIGIGLNPYLKRTIGWSVVNENRQGTLFVAFGENGILGAERFIAEHRLRHPHCGPFHRSASDCQRWPARRRIIVFPL
jgi:leucyl aminopeptidase (aminopeptidase T)